VTLFCVHLLREGETTDDVVVGSPPTDRCTAGRGTCH